MTAGGTASYSGKPSTTWGAGDYPLMAQRLEPAALAAVELAAVESLPGSITLVLSDVAEAVDFLVRTAGHVLAERDRLTREGRWEQLLADLAGLVEARSRRNDDRVEIPLDYLLALAHRHQPVSG